MRELHAWENGHHVGVFSEDDEERISFAYDANEGLPISLSLPRTGGWRDQAPRNFLDNLLPDNPNVRQAMREHLNASSAGVFDLLDRVDATGGLVFSLSPEPPIPSPTLRLISDSQIANEIDRIERTGTTGGTRTATAGSPWEGRRASSHCPAWTASGIGRI